MTTWQHRLTQCRHRAQSKNGKVFAAFFLITPADAEKMLSLNTMNRQQRRSALEIIRRDMEQGTWLLTHQGIAFMSDFKALIDGQHRLRNIVSTGQPQEMLVSWGFEAEVIKQIDKVAPRSNPDNREILGEASEFAKQQKVITAVIKRVYNGVRYDKASFTYEEESELISTHHDALHRMMTLMRSSSSNRHRGITNAPVRAAVVRAYYHVKPEVLDRFCRLLLGGPDERPEDAVVRMHREWLLQNARGRNSNWQAYIYARTAWVIATLAKGRMVTKLRLPESEPFPIPSDKDATGKAIYTMPKNPLKAPVAA